MAKTAHAIASLIRERIKNYDQTVENHNVGKIITVGDGIALVTGLDEVKEGEILDFGEGVLGIVLNLDEEVVGVATLGDDTLLGEGGEVKRTNRVISVPVGDKLFGRVVDAIGRPIDGRGPIEAEAYKHVFSDAPGVMSRQSVDSPIETGILVIDSMIPIGKGQRELIIGDRQTGKTAIAIDAIINQKDKKIKCVYVAIGQKNSTIAQIAKKLEDNDALKYTTIVVAGASELAPMQYLAPYTGATIAENVMNKGGDALVVYDDLSKHAVAYRTLSLLLKRPPGREAYPGDVFFLHSQLLERAARLNDDLKGGSVTALPIVETQQGDISAYIPTNVISITDGQIFTLESLFNKGQRPAVDVGYSVSRVGSAAQIKAMKQNTASLKLELAQYNEMLAFAQFGSDLDQNTRRILSHGGKIYSMIKQAQYSPIDQSLQVFFFFVIKEKIINIIPTEEMDNFKRELLHFLKSDINMRPLIHEVKTTKELSPETTQKAKVILAKFAKNFTSHLAHYNKMDHEEIPFIAALKKAKNDTKMREEALKEAQKDPQMTEEESPKEAKKRHKKDKKAAKEAK